MTYQKAANVLFTEWKKSPLHDADSFVTDGILDWSEWESQPLRVMFLLKEAYSNETDGAGFDWATRMLDEQFPWGNFWMAARWIAAIRAGYTDTGQQLPDFDDRPSQANANKLFRGIAWVNLKKSKGQQKSNFSDILYYAQQDREQLTRQIALINPDVIVGNNVLEFYKALYPQDNVVPLTTDDWIYQHDRRVFLNCWHYSKPGNRRGDYAGLVEALPKVMATVAAIRAQSAR